MSESFLPPLRHEVQNFLRSCDNLMSIGASPLYPPLTAEELRMVNYYVDEVAKMVGRLAKV